MAEKSEIGIIVGEASATEFYFVTDNVVYPPKWEYIYINSQESIDGKLQKVKILAHVEKNSSISDILTRDEDLEVVKRILDAKIEGFRTLGEAKVLGYALEKGGKIEIKLPRRTLTPGSPIYIAPKDFLDKFFTFPEEESLFIGNLITRPEIEVNLNISGLKRHLALIAQTGAGKSYTAGIIAEELLKKGATLLIIDPHSDYVFLGQNKDGSPTDLAENIKVYRNPGSTGRYKKEEIGKDKVKDYEIKFSDLLLDEIYEIIGTSSYPRINDAIDKAIETLRGSHTEYTPEDVIDKLTEMSQDDGLDKKIRNGAKDSLVYIKRLHYLPVFGNTSTNTAEFLEPCKLSVLDLSGIDDYSMDYIVNKLLNEIYREIIKNESSYPIFIFIEEAHNFVPHPSRGFKTKSSLIINKIAAEGRKFGIFLVLITQRPGKIHEDSLSQCNTQIILRLTNPKDQSAVENSSESMTKELLSNLPGLNIGEAVITGEAVKVPVLVKIREKKTKEGGADVDVLAALKRARQEKGIDKDIAKTRERVQKGSQDGTMRGL